MPEWGGGEGGCPCLGGGLVRCWDEWDRGCQAAKQPSGQATGASSDGFAVTMLSPAGALRVRVVLFGRARPCP